MGLLKKFFEPVDMTEGSPWKKIVLFTVPMLVGNIAQQLYNTVDSVVVGNYVGDNALAAVGADLKPVDCAVCRDQCRRGDYGFTVFRREAAGRIVADNR